MNLVTLLLNQRLNQLLLLSQPMIVQQFGMHKPKGLLYPREQFTSFHRFIDSRLSQSKKTTCK